MFKNKRALKARIFEFYYTEASIFANNRWCVDMDFRIIGEDEGTVHHNTVTVMICSPEYKSQPGMDNPDEKTLVMSSLDKEKSQAFAYSKIDETNSLQLTDWDQYYEALKKWFHVDD